MKKIMVIALLLVAFGASAEDWLSVDFAFQAQYVPFGEVVFSDSDYSAQDAFGLNFLIEALAFGHVIIGGEVDNMFNDSIYDFSFVPTGIMYTVYAGIKINNSMKIIAEHRCDHPVLADSNATAKITDGGYTRIYFELKTHVDF